MKIVSNSKRPKDLPYLFLLLGLFFLLLILAFDLGEYYGRTLANWF